MHCEKCQAEVSSNSFRCEECGAPIPQNIDGFDNTVQIQQQLRLMVIQNDRSAFRNKVRFIGLMRDYISDHKKECRLLVNMFKLGALEIMLKEQANREIAVTKTKSYLIGDLFIAENAAEFVIACFTYLLGWPYDSCMRIKDGEAEVVEEEEKPMHLSVDTNVFRPTDALRYRLRGNVTIAEGYTKIENFCFENFRVKTVQLPSTLLAIGDYAFSSCKNLRGIELPPSLKLIRQGAFSQCMNLVVIKIPKGVLEIEDSTFEFCSSLEVIEIPPTVSSIGAAAFSGCEKLRKLFLPDSVKFIDKNAFSYCPQLTIHCFENSYVHKYCIVNGIDCELVASAPSGM